MRTFVTPAKAKAPNNTRILVTHITEDLPSKRPTDVIEHFAAYLGPAHVYSLSYSLACEEEYGKKKTWHTPHAIDR